MVGEHSSSSYLSGPGDILGENTAGKTWNQPDESGSGRISSQAGTGLGRRAHPGPGSS